MPLLPIGFLIVASLGGCRKEVPPAREPVGILYVAVPEMQIHEQPADQSPVIATFREGESVTIYSTRGRWAEVQLFNEKSGWARKDRLSASREEVAATSTPTFRKPPSPIFSQKKLQGEIVFEASVTKDGDVMSVRTLSNTTGDPGIESQNRVQLSNAKFYPLLINGRPQPFVYEYRVAY